MSYLVSFAAEKRTLGIQGLAFPAIYLVRSFLSQPNSQARVRVQVSAAFRRSLPQSQLCFQRQHTPPRGGGQVQGAETFPREGGSR